MNDRLYIATLESRNFAFEGVGTTDVEAVNVLIQGLRSHGDQYNLGWAWWYQDDMRAAADDGKPVAHVEEPRRLIDDGVVQVRAVDRGQPYRDGQPIPFQPTFEECGCCGHYHRPNYFGDCRNDAERFNPNDLDDRYGENGWIQVDLPEQSEASGETDAPESARRVEQRRGGWFVIPPEGGSEDWSGPWKTEAAANLALAGDYDGAHALERNA